MLIDLLLALTLLWIAFKIINTEVLFETIIYFIVFGLVLGLVWAKLGAIDLALAEIALGSGITGALLFDTYAFIKKREKEKDV